MGDGKNLQESIKSKGTNVRKVAKAAGIPATTLYSIVQKDSSIRLDLALKLANELEIDVNEICSTGLLMDECFQMPYEWKDMVDSNNMKKYFTNTLYPLLCLFGQDSILDVVNILISFYQLDDEARREVLEMMKIKLEYHKERERVEKIIALKKHCMMNKGGKGLELENIIRTYYQDD